MRYVAIAVQMLHALLVLIEVKAAPLYGSILRYYLMTICRNRIENLCNFTNDFAELKFVVTFLCGCGYAVFINIVNNF